MSYPTNGEPFTKENAAMRIIPTLTTAVTTAAVAALGLGIAGPAHAAGVQLTDPSDTSHGSDLLAVKVAHRQANLVVVTTHDDLRRSPSSGSGGLVYLDTDRADRGPEYVVVGGYFEGTDYVLLETEGFGVAQWGEPVEGSYELSIDYAADKVRTKIAQEAIGSPDEVRVAVKASGPSAATTDWVGAPKSFTPWVARG